MRSGDAWQWLPAGTDSAAPADATGCCVPPPGSNAMSIFHSRIAAVLVPVVAAGVIHAPGVVHAQVAATPPQPTPQQPLPADTPRVDFAQVDGNVDGSISRQEALAADDLQASFELLDTDRNQTISPTEFARWSRAGKSTPDVPKDPATAPGGSAGAQHVPD